MIGKQLSPILAEMEQALWEFEDVNGAKPEYTMEGFRAATKIFMSALMDKMWELQSDETISMQDRVNMVKKAGQDVRSLIKTYTNIDTHNLYKNGL